jgi:hypothetical protein
MKYILTLLLPVHLIGQTLNPAYKVADIGSMKKTLVISVEKAILTLNDDKSSWRWEAFDLTGADYPTLRRLFKHPIDIGYLKMKKGRFKKKGLVLIRRKAEWQTVLYLRG